MSNNELVEDKIAAINAEIERKNREAEQLLQYLIKQQTIAKNEEEEEEDDLKKQGIIVGQHIPSLPSKLNLDPALLSEYETFSSTLLVAKDLINQNKTNFLRRTGNLPISDLIETKREANAKYTSTLDPDKPHYLTQTNNSKVKGDRNAVRFAETLHQGRTTSPRHQDTFLEGVTLGAGATNMTNGTYKQTDNKANKKEKSLSMKEKLEHENVLKSLNHKLNYLRNPRNNPNAVTKMLTKPKEYYDKFVAAGGDGPTTAGGDGGSLSDEENTSSSRLKTKYSKYIKLQNNPLFVCEPGTILFMDYEIGQKYTRTVSFRNVSAVSRTARVLAPKNNKLFTITPLKFPPNCPNGMIAPGMSVICTLTFVPIELGDFEDFIQVDTEAGSTKVRIVAQREPPSLTIPSSINLGFCLVGDANRSALVCSNTGGSGRFTILDHIQDESNIPEYDPTRSCLRLAPFTIYPVEFSLNKGESAEVVFEFVPLVRGTLTRKFSIRCDNGQIKHYTLQAIGKELRVSTVELNGVPFSDQDVTTYQDIVFNEIFTGTEASQKVMIVNDTGISIEYEWIWLDTSIPQRDWHRKGQEIIFAREQKQNPFHNSLTEGDMETMRKPVLFNGNNATTENPENAQVNASLLRSMQAHMNARGDDDHASNSVEVHQNSVKEGCFEIFPARGVIAGEGASDIQFLFSPNRQMNTSLRAVMMIKSVPYAALPGPQQTTALQKLKTQGHGLFPRLLSWLEDIGTVGTVTEYQKPNGALTTLKSLLPITTIIGLLLSQIIPEEIEDTELQSQLQDEDMPRINRWIRNIVKHVFGIRKRESLGDDNSSMVGTIITQVNADGQTKEIIPLYEWKPISSADEHDSQITDKTGRAINPFPITPVELRYVELVEEDSDDDGSYFIEKYVDPNEDPNADPNSLRSLSGADRKLLSEIWIDSSQVVKIFGKQICSMLNEKVGHEAIDFLKECSLTHLASINFYVHAVSVSPCIAVHPPCLQVGEHLSVGKDWEGKVTLINTSDAPVQLTLQLGQFQIKRLYSRHNNATLDEFDEDLLLQDDISIGTADSRDSLKSMVSLRASTEHVLLMPKSSEVITFGMSISALGLFQVKIPWTSTHPSIYIEPITVEVTISGPKLHFQISEIDLGLLGVGQESKFYLSFLNEGDIPAMFMMKPTLHIDNMIPANSNVKRLDSTTRPSRNDTNLPMSARSTSSRQSTTQSEDFSVADSTATSTDFKIELKNATVIIEPSSGVIAPQCSMSVQVICKTGKLAQRIRGMIESRLFDQSGQSEITRQYLNLRGEVQTPKIVLYPMHQALGQVYVGRPVNFQFQLENICNLPTKYKFLRPGGASSLFHFSITPTKGTIEAKEKLLIQGTFTAVVPGMIDDVLSCKLFGVSFPMGFSIKAFVKGILLEFITLSLNAPLPLPLASVDDAQFPNNEKPPEPQSIEPILLGEDVPLYERRQGRFVIRNLSAIAAPFEIKPRRFIVMEKYKRFAATGSAASVNSASTATLHPMERHDLFLAPHEDGVNKFQSELGKQYIGVTMNRRADRQFLYSGYGASYYMDTVQGILPPWGVQEVNITAFNDIPGNYDDDIEIIVREGELLRKFHVPIKMTVIGCPVIIERNTLGMTEINPHKETNTNLFGKLCLQLGQTCEHGSYLQREFIVRNNGSKNGLIKWGVRGIAGKAYGPLKISLQVTSEGAIKSLFRYWEDIAKESPFHVTPESQVIKPYEKKTFKVTLSQNTPAVLERALLTASIIMKDEEIKSTTTSLSILDPIDDGSSSVVKFDLTKKDSEHDKDNDDHNNDHSLAASQTNLSLLAKKPQSFNLDFVVEGEYLYPQVIIDKHHYSVPHPITTVKSEQCLHLRAKSTLLFTSTGQLSAQNMCTRLINIKNPLDFEVIVHVSTEGSLILKDSVDATPNSVKKLTSHASHKSSISGGGDDGSVVSNNTLRSSSVTSTGKVLQLSPHQETKLLLVFNPKKQVREQLMSTFSTEVGKPTEQTSYLLFSYPTGQCLRLPVITSISTPFLTGSSPRLYFGICHVRQTCQAVFLLSNPTDVPARWTVSHVIGGGQWKQSTAIRVKGFEKVPETDDPEAFSITPQVGTIDGPTVSVAAAMAAPPKDYNRKADTIVPERIVQASWASSTLTIGDTLEVKHNLQHKNTTTDPVAGACYPMPITIVFTPKKNVRYCSRFRFSCEFANSFDLVVQGEGTFEEHEHRPLNPVPR